MADKLTHTCDACGHEVSGATRSDLQGEGWQWHKINRAKKDEWFVICDECVALYQPVWEEAKASA